MIRTFSASSLWKLSGMTLGIVAVAMGTMWFFTTWALRRSFDDIGRAIILDDLGEYGERYSHGGVEAVSGLFVAGGHDEHNQIVRLIDPEGVVRLDVLIPEQPDVQWPDLDRDSSPSMDEITWHQQRIPRGLLLTIGRRRLPDGAELWFGRTNQSDLDAIDQVHRLILIAILITTILAIGPILWFAARVLRPVHDLMDSARELARGGPLDQRLETSAAIPELRRFSTSFNASLDRIQSLTEELEAANDQLAHELRTPLARIRGNVEKILKSSDTDTSHRHAARTIAEIERATELIQRILSIRAGDSGAMKLQRETVFVAKLLRETFDLYSAAAEEKALDFQLSLPPKDEHASVDRRRIQQALCNLLDNAFAYTPSGGSVTLALTFSEHAAEIRVRDNGPGLGDGDHDRIWRRFMRGSAASAENPGIGLGLSLVHAVLKAHRGECEARNHPDGGAEFFIRFPLDETTSTVS
ncbi:MAG: HAMP domain-containing histidine kinase [Verrucomicrobiae bacterium]|nr:HAMP domain-containing histidine kinase [Verrucomicrobiae bacterium]